MLSFNVVSPTEVSHKLAARFRSARLARGWSRDELGARAGVAVPTLRRFEDTGKISLDRLLQLASVLGMLDAFDRLASAEASVQHLADMERAVVAATRQRGRSMRKDIR